MDIRWKKALFVLHKGVDCTEMAVQYAYEMDLKLEIWLERRSQEEFYQKLSDVGYYFDLKGLTTSDVLSVSGIQALEHGCKVLVDTGEIVERFYGTSVCEYWDLYQELLI